MKESAQLGVPFLEVDLRVSKDGTPFLFHDGKLRSSNYVGDSRFNENHPEDLTDAELRTLRLPGDSNAKIPTLTEGLAIVASHNSALEMDIKRESNEILKTILDVVKARSEEQKVLVQCQKPESVRFIQENYPSVATLYRCKSEDEIPAVLLLKPTVVELEGWRSEAAIRTLHEAGIRVLINVAESRSDRPAIWEKLFEQGVDIIMTDHGDEMIKWLRAILP